MIHLKSGLHLKVSRGLYTHHGIYIGDNQVIHYSGFAEAFKKGSVEQTSLESFLGGVDSFQVVNYPSYQSIYSAEEIAYRAQSCIGEDKYNLFFNNCEHFACWCVTGKARSEQVQELMQYTTNAVFSYYAFQKSKLLTTNSTPIATMTNTPAINSTLTNIAVGGIVGLGTSTITTTAITTGVGIIAATPVVIAAAPVVFTGFVIGGLFSLFNN